MGTLSTDDVRRTFVKLNQRNTFTSAREREREIKRVIKELEVRNAKLESGDDRDDDSL